MKKKTPDRKKQLTLEQERFYYEKMGRIVDQASREVAKLVEEDLKVEKSKKTFFTSSF